MSIKKFCAWQGCNEAVDIGKAYCPKHMAQYELRQKESQRNYDKSIRYKRDKKYYDFYHSNEWLQMTAYINNKYKGLCLWSYYMDHAIVRVEEVHHIISLRDDFTQRLNISNLIPLGFTIHKRIEGIYKRGRKEKADMQCQLRELITMWDREMKG